MGFRTNKKTGKKYPIGVGKSGNNNSPTNPKSKLTPQRRLELLNGINAEKVSKPPVVENITELSDKQNSILRKGNIWNELDRSQGHFIFLKDARKLQ